MQQLARIEERIEGIEKEGVLDNKAMMRKTAKEGKSILRKDRLSLSQLEEDLGLGFVVLAVLRPFGDIKTNDFETGSSSWKLKDS